MRGGADPPRCVANSNQVCIHPFVVQNVGIGFTSLPPNRADVDESSTAAAHVTVSMRIESRFDNDLFAVHRREHGRQRPANFEPHHPVISRRTTERQRCSFEMQFGEGSDAHQRPVELLRPLDQIRERYLPVFGALS
jgi:hypothetical protein